MFSLYHQVARCGSSSSATKATDEGFPCRSVLRGPPIQTQSSGSQRPCAALHSRSGPWSGLPGKRRHPGPLKHEVCSCPNQCFCATGGSLTLHVMCDCDWCGILEGSLLASLSTPLYFTQHVLYFLKIVENETRSDPPDESPLLLSAADGVSLFFFFSSRMSVGPCHKTIWPLFYFWCLSQWESVGTTRPASSGVRKYPQPTWADLLESCAPLAKRPRQCDQPAWPVGRRRSTGGRSITSKIKMESPPRLNDLCCWACPFCRF